MEENSNQQVDQQTKENKYETWTPHPKSMHSLWTACRYVRDNPGCSRAVLKAHLEGVYPHGRIGDFAWVCNTWYTGRKNKVDGTWFGGTLGLAGYLMYVPTSSKKMRRGMYILPRGEALAAEPEPPHKFAKAKTMPTAWLDDCEVGMLMAPRSRTRTTLLYRTDGDNNRGFLGAGYLKPGEIVTLMEVEHYPHSNNDHMMRKYGRPWANARLTILHPTCGMCWVYADSVKPLVNSKKKGGKHANQ